jgi:hypothetical protein
MVFPSRRIGWSVPTSDYYPAWLAAALLEDTLHGARAANTSDHYGGEVEVILGLGVV